MQASANFYFHGSLNDFVRKSKRHTWQRYTYSGHQTVKDIIEALGVPHVEVREILVQNEKVDFGYRLQPDDSVQVYPHDGHEEELQQGIAEPRFVLDVHLGTLAHSLRMLGFDTLYETHLHDKEIAALAQTEQRIVLTRDVNLLKNKAIPVGYWLRSQHTEEQLAEVLQRFGLVGKIKPFTRCMVCNGTIEAVAKEAVLDQLPPKTQLYFDEFYQCTSCRRVYWKGSHYQRMEELVRCISELP